MPVSTGLLRPKATQALAQGGAGGMVVSRYFSLVRSMPQAVLNGEPRVGVLRRVAQECMLYFRGRQNKVDPLCELERAVAVPRVRPDFVRFWFGRLKGFPRVEEVVEIITNGARVDVAGEGDLSSAIAYGNHNSTQAHHNLIVAKIFDDVRLSRAFALPRSMAGETPGLRLSPMGVVVSPSLGERSCRALYSERVGFEGLARFSPEDRAGLVLAGGGTTN